MADPFIRLFCHEMRLMGIKTLLLSAYFLGGMYAPVGIACNRVCWGSAFCVNKRGAGHAKLKKKKVFNASICKKK